MLEDQMVISCYNEEDAKTLMEIAEYEGFLWASGHRPTQLTYFSDQYVVRYSSLFEQGESDFGAKFLISQDGIWISQNCRGRNMSV